VPNKAPDPTQSHDDQKEIKVAQPKPASKRQWHCQTQQTRQNPNEQTLSGTGFLGASRNNNGSKESQGYLKPRQQLGTDPRGKVADGRLVGSAPSLKGQDKRIDGNDDRQEEETQRNHCERRAQDAEPSNT